MIIKINKSRPVEELVGPNYHMVRQLLGRVHVSNSFLEAARRARPKNMRAYPVALRRGWAKCVLETWAEYRDLYDFVTRGR